MSESEKLVVKPAPGRLIRHPRTMRPIAEGGQDVTSEKGYFHRMLRVGDVVVVPTAPPAAKPLPKKEA
jgi:hypothetical protein